MVLKHQDFKVKRVKASCQNLSVKRVYFYHALVVQSFKEGQFMICNFFYNALFATEWLVSRKRANLLFRQIRKKNLVNYERNLQKKRKDKSNFRPINKLSLEDSNFSEIFNNYILKCHPFLITNFLNAPHKIANSVLDQMMSRYSNEKVILTRDNISYKDHNVAFHLEKKFLTLDKASNLMKSKYSNYNLRFFKVPGDSSNLLKLVQYNSIKKLGKIGNSAWSNFFIGGKNSATLTHVDHIVFNLHLQLKGRKVWELYTYENSPFMYPLPLKNYFFTSEVNFLDYPVDEYPLYNYRKGYKVTANPGDLLFVPPFCWHNTRYLDFSLSFGTFWLRPFNILKMPFTLFLLGLFGNHHIVDKMEETNEHYAVLKLMDRLSGKSMPMAHQ